MNSEISKPIKRKIVYKIVEFCPINSNDLPNFLKERDEKIKRYDNLVELLKLKDQIIWESILEKQNIKLKPEEAPKCELVK